jgi:hypothetical protein
MRITITDIPPGVPLVSGLTGTVTIRDAESREGDGWLFQSLQTLADRIHNIVHRDQPRPHCGWTAYS